MAQLNDLIVTGNSTFINPINGNARNGVYYVKGTQTASTSAWTGVIPIPALYDGLTIMYYLPYASTSTSVTLNLTLSNGTTTGAVNCYIGGSNRITTHFGVASSIKLTYYSAGSISISGTATTDNRWISDGQWNSQYNFSGTTFYSGNSNNATHDANNMTANGSYYYNSNGPSQSLGATTDDGSIYSQAYNANWVSQLAQDYRNGNVFVRGKNNGTWTDWKKVDAGTVNGLTVQTAVPANAVFTDNNTTYTFANGTNGFTVTPSGGSAQTVTVTPSITNNVTGSGTSGKVPKFTGANTIGNGYSVDTTVTSGSANLVTSGAVYTAIDNLPEPMVFKGSLGTGGTITALPVDGTASVGDTYKVITAGTYASQSAKVGDTFICDSKTSSANTWVLIPSGDEPSGTVTSVTIKATSPIAIDSSSAITTSGTRTLSHANSGVTAGTYNSVTVNATGHVTAGSSITATGSSATGIGIADHSTSSITGVQASTTTASKVTLGTAISVPNVTGATDVTVPTAASSATTVPIKNASATSIPNVTSVGSASNWVFEDITVPKAASSATSIPNVTAVGSGSFTQGAFSGGSGSFTATVSNGVLSFSHTHTAATHGADTHVHTAPTLGTAISVTGVSGSTTASHVKSGGNGTAPTLGTAISIIGVQSTTTSVTGVSGSTTASKVTLGTAISVPNVTAATDVTVPIKNTSATTVVTGKTHTVTDNGHTHTLS